MEQLGPVDTSPLMAGLHEHLVSLLRGLNRDDWSQPTVAGAWTVRDVVAHIIDGQARRLSAQRDDHSVGPDRDVSHFPGLVDYLNELNATWVGAMQRLSPSLLIDVLELVGPQYASFVAELDPDARALFPVAWADESESKNWFDIGRDFTELWHHQAQVRLAVKAEPLEQPRWLRPVLELSVRALRRALSALERPKGTTVMLHIDGDAGGTWAAVAGSEGWSIYSGYSGVAPAPAASVTMSESVAWKLFFNALSESEADSLVRVEGDQELIHAVRRTRSVMV